jgi:hypothetical protein
MYEITESMVLRPLQLYLFSYWVTKVLRTKLYQNNPKYITNCEDMSVPIACSVIANFILSHEVGTSNSAHRMPWVIFGRL